MSAPSEAYHSADSALVRRISSGDAEAFAELYDRNANILFALALRILNERRNAEEVLQDVFLQVWRSASSYDQQRGTIRAWLITLTRSRAIDRLRSVRARHDMTSVDDERGETPQLTDGMTSADRRIYVRRALDELPAEQRTVIEMAYFDGLTQTEIAERLSQPLGTVKTRVRLGMHKLRESLL